MPPPGDKAAHWGQPVTACARSQRVFISFGIRGHSESARIDAAQSQLKSASVFYTSQNYIKTILIVAAATGSPPRGRIRRALACRDLSKKRLSVLPIRCYRRVIRFDTNLKLGRKLHISRARLPRATSSSLAIFFTGPYRKSFGFTSEHITRRHVRA